MVGGVRIAVCLRGAARILDSLRAGLPADEVFECSADEVAAAARESDVLVPTISPIGEEALASPRVRLVQQFGAGLDVVDVASASRHGIWVANVPTGESANAASVAELVVLFLLAFGRRFRQAQENVRIGRFAGPIGTTLLGKTVVILGYGGIGRAVAERLRPFGVRLLAVSRQGPRGAEPDPELERHVAVGSMAEVLAEADFVVIATPLDERTRGLVGREALAATKRGAFLVNVARGPVVEREALLEALRSGRLAGAGLDVFWEEPPDPNDPLFAENVIATPHVGGSTDASFRTIAAAVAANVERLRRGEPPRFCVNTETIDAAALRRRIG